MKNRLFKNILILKALLSFSGMFASELTEEHRLLAPHFVEVYGYRTLRFLSKIPFKLVAFCTYINTETQTGVTSEHILNTGLSDPHIYPRNCDLLSIAIREDLLCSNGRFWSLISFNPAPNTVAQIFTISDHGVSGVDKVRS